MSKLYAVALALLVLAVPAMAQGSGYSPNVQVNVTVAPFGELWHSGTEVNLTATDGGSYFASMLNMNVGGNNDFEVWLNATDMTTDPEAVVHVVVDADPNWTTDARWALQPSGNYRMYWQDGDISEFGVTRVTFQNTGTAPSAKKVYDFTNPSLANAKIVPVLYGVIGSGQMGIGTGSMTAVYTMVGANS